jgi:hypothetical protein
VDSPSVRLACGWRVGCRKARRTLQRVQQHDDAVQGADRNGVQEGMRASADLGDIGRVVEVGGGGVGLDSLLLHDMILSS